MLHMALSAFFFAVMAVFARFAGARLPAQEVVLARAVISTALSFVMLRRAGAPFRGNRPKMLVLRGLTGFLSLSCYFWTVIHLPFAEAVLLAQTAPIFTALIAWKALGERPGPRFAPAAAMVLVGVVLVASPSPADFQGAQLGWVVVGLLGAVAAGSAYTEVRALSRGEHPLTIVLWFQMTMIFLSLPGTFVSGAVLPRGADWLWLAGVGLFGQAGQVFLTEGLRRTPAGRASLANPLVILFGAAIGWLLFHENLDWGDLLGAALLVFGLIFSGSAPRNALPRSSAS